MLGRLGIALLAGVIGFAGAAAADEPVLTGTVVYLERMLLPAGAVAEVTLEDVSLADAPATALGTVSVPATTSPTRFTLPYDAAAIAAGHSYALRASIRADGELMFTTMDHVAFDPARLDGYEVLVRRVAAAPRCSARGWPRTSAVPACSTTCNRRSPSRRMAPSRARAVATASAAWRRLPAIRSASGRWPAR